MRFSRAVLTTAAVLAVPLALALPARGVAPTYDTVKLSGADGGTEPRITVAPDGTLHAITNRGGEAVLYSSTDHGVSWSLRSTLPNQTMPTIDVDVLALPEGRLVASELDFAGINFRNAYSDDNGVTWHQSSGASELADTDRQWLAYGPVSPITGKRTVYLLWHNLASGFGNHNMYVQTSLDGGETFLPPVPTTTPGMQAFADLQCADSSGPSTIAVDQTTGRIYVLFGTRGSSVAPAGGCGASVAPGPIAVNVVSPTRLWVVTSDSNLPGTWTESLAVDRVGTGQVVGTQLGSLAIDTSGNAYVAFTESASSTDYTSALKYVYAAPGLASWTGPKTVAAATGSGNVLPLVVAGDAGRLDFAYFHGSGGSWYATVAQTINGTAATPTFTTTQVSTVVAMSGTAAQLMGVCGSGPTAGIENGFPCGRSPDVFGLTLDAQGRFVTSWPAAGGTYVTTQQTGDDLYAP